MTYRTRIKYTAEQKSEIWDRWKKGESIKDCRYTRGLPDRLGSEFSLQVYSPCVR